MQNLSPDILARLRALQPGQSYEYGGMTYSPGFGASSGQSLGGENNDQNFASLQYINETPTDSVNRKGVGGVNYNPDGSYLGQGRYLDDKSMQMLALAALAAGGMHFGFGGLGAYSGMTVPTEAAMAAQAAGLESSLAPYLSGGMMGPLTEAGMAASVAPFEASLSPYLAAGAAGAAGGAAGAAAGSSGTGAAAGGAMGPLTMAQTGAAVAPFEASISPYFTGMAATTGLGALGGMGGLLGPAAVALGAVAGSKRQDQSATSQKRMDPRLDPYVFDDLLPQVKGLLSEQMSPQRKAQNDAIRKAGMGLLSTPAMGNMFNKFYPGGR